MLKRFSGHRQGFSKGTFFKTASNAVEKIDMAVCIRLGFVMYITELHTEADHSKRIRLHWKR